SRGACAPGARDHPGVRRGESAHCVSGALAGGRLRGPPAPPPTDGTALAAARQTVHGAGARLERWSVDPRFTPHGRGRVMLCDLDARVTGVPGVLHCQWLGKWYDSEADGARVAGVLAELAASDCRARGGPEVSGVIAYDRARRLLFLTYEAGEPLSAAIGRDASTVLTAVGRALAALHATRVTR